MNIIDTHTHLYLDDFKEDIDEVILRAKEEGVTHFLLPSISASHLNSMKRLKNKYPNQMMLMTGLHPVSVKDDFEKELNIVLKELETNTYVAVGEIGIDLYWDKTYLEQQKEAFRIQIRWAKKKNLPIVIHCREAFDEVFDILETEKEGLKGVFHCFTGNLEDAQRAISYNLTLGIGGVVTFKNGKINKFINQIPIDRIVLETDAPYLAPVPFRGKRNESFYIKYIIETMAQIYGLSEEIIAEKTTNNAKRVFGL